MEVSDIAQLLEQARKHVQRATNTAMVYTCYEIGRRIVEEEQRGQERASYGKQVLKGLSEYLTERFGRGFSEDGLGNMRKFYLVYSRGQISETASRKLDAGDNLPTIATGRKFFLSWSHYLSLMRISNPDERHFYEIEAARNDWSLSELLRQTDSALYERLALSRDKEGVRELASKGEIVEKPSDAVRDPYVLELLGLKEETRYLKRLLEDC